MIDVTKTLIRKHPHLALGCLGVCFLITPLVMAVNLKLAHEHLNWQPPRWTMLPLMLSFAVAVVIGSSIVGGSVGWWLHRRRVARRRKGVTPNA